MASLYTVYFDESGTHGESNVAVVAGFISNRTEWEAFSREWHQVLSDSGLDYFHMTDFENRRRQFHGWTEDKKRDLLDKLLPIIHEHTFSSIGCIVLKQQFDSILSDVAKQICGDIYGYAALTCYRHLGIVLKDTDAWMECTMETGAKGAGALQLIVSEDSKIPKWQDDNRIISLDFQSKHAFMPLQAADILAYELYKQSARQFGTEERPTRYPLKVLGRKKHQWYYAQEKHLQEFNEDLTAQLVQLERRESSFL
ncbi:MAG: DUF3800 domain-containing protein [Chloroflexi bacterium]|nr:DUF3800 domain-containing protein [Chloroflexota bacterium]